MGKVIQMNQSKEHTAIVKISSKYTKMSKTKDNPLQRNNELVRQKCDDFQSAEEGYGLMGLDTGYRKKKKEKPRAGE